MEPTLPKKKRKTLPNGEVWNQASWAQARKRAIASLEPYCAICNGYIDLEAKAFTPNACEVDHIIPTSRGGALYELENLQLTHTRCNRQKGAKMASDYEKPANQNICPLSNVW